MHESHSCANLRRYAFWGDTIASELGRRLSALPVVAERFVVNVASEEYWAVVGKHLAALGENVPVMFRFLLRVLFHVIEVSNISS